MDLMVLVLALLAYGLVRSLVLMVVRTRAIARKRR